MNTQKEELLKMLPSYGWNVFNAESYDLQWWADDIWLLESIWSPTGSLVYLTFLVDPQINNIKHRKKGEGVWAIMASKGVPDTWQGSKAYPSLTLGQGWKDRLAVFLKELESLRT
jgi:hypothetical protein